MGEVEQLSENEQVVLAVAVGLLPCVLILVAPAVRNGIERTVIAVALRDGNFDCPVPQLMDVANEVRHLVSWCLAASIHQGGRKDGCLTSLSESPFSIDMSRVTLAGSAIYQPRLSE